MDLVAVGLVIVGAVAALGWWLNYQLFLRNGRLLLRIEALEEELGQRTEAEEVVWEGLPIGSVGHDFELPALAGGRQTLSRWRGHRVLLIFFSPHCDYCQGMLPDLATSLSSSNDRRLVPLILSTGDPEENRALLGAHGIGCPVLLQEQMEVAPLYRVRGTPMAYLIDEQGRTGSELAVGAEAVLALLRSASGGVAERSQPEAAARSGDLSDLVTPVPSERHVNRNGLAAGTPAPDFRLPRLDQGELSLEEYHGRRVLLIFSDPECEPCNQLAPRLEQLHRRSSDLELLMVSRGAPDANRARVAEYGLTFPVVLQRHWEVSRDYGMVAAPIGYLIDEQGVIAADVAVGSEPILALASHLAAGATTRSELPIER